MPKLRPILLLALAIPACAAPSAAAEAIVPPGNSAATQYTETFPTSGGERDDESHKGGAVPGKTLGAHNAHRLESKGAEGKAAAKIAAETAPASATGTGSAAGEVTAAGGSGSGNKGGTQGSGAGGGGAGGGSVANGNSGGATTDAGAPADHPSGSSGLGEVLGQATGSSDSGTLGLLLPLIILCAVAFSVFYLWRQRQRVV
jgi:cobalamin biosynthesis Mg chelatase CobN